MANLKTGIEWTDATWSPVTGCTKVSPGCANCYIERTPAFRIHGRQFIKGATDLQLHADRLEQPLHWRKQRRVFVNSLSDLFHEHVPDDFIDKVFAVMALAPQHTFQLLTKRPDRMRTYINDPRRRAVIAGEVGRVGDATQPSDGNPGQGSGRRLRHEAQSGLGDLLSSDLETHRLAWPLPNVWLGTSIENQRFADERIPLLLETPAAVRFVSAEPLLEAVDLSTYVEGHEDHGTPFSDPPARTVGGCIGWTPPLDWVICGGESGPQSRPFDVAWARSIVKQCRSAGVACFVKQLGAHVIDRNDAGFEGDTPTSWPMDTETVDLDARGWQGDPVRVKLTKKGGDPAEWPSDLRVRNFPSDVR